MQHQKSRNENRLFPCEEKNNSSAYSKKFAQYRKKVNALPRHDMELRDFHSFRHCVRTKLTENGSESWLIDGIICLTSKNWSIGEEVYLHSNLIQVKNKTMQRLKYDIEFSHIQIWDKCEFTRKKY